MRKIKTFGDAEQTIAMILIVIVMGAALIWAVGVGESKQEQADCLQWQQQAKDYKGFYIVKWQAIQCASYGIAVNAPVR